ncbi:transcriptional regulator, GntR family [Desulfosarcina variabilis str. Montpellier]|uniref:GntR family transcriptional regulator n=1 Tax=Desulfosarcina variabilis TaxID=2300 RepID=UPI003AFB22A8
MQIQINIDKNSGIPVYIQLWEQIRIMIRNGSLKAGDLMPTTRGLAVQLGINVNTVARVYRDLQTTGHLSLQRGVGTFVADGVDRPLAKQEFAALAQKVAQIIQISRDAGITCAELTQFITTKWKEDDHV